MTERESFSAVVSLNQTNIFIFSFLVAKRFSGPRASKDVVYNQFLFPRSQQPVLGNFIPIF